MTQQERAEARALCAAATPEPWEQARPSREYVVNPVTNFNVCMTRRSYDAEFIARARTLLPAALDALDEAEKQMQGDRDQLRARAEALERAVKFLGACKSCAHEECRCFVDPCLSCKCNGIYRNWQLDEVRFAEEEGGRA